MWQSKERLLATPAWLFAIATALLPAWRLANRLRCRSGSGAGLCRACGYDLRATPGRCPECGTAVTPAANYAARSPTPTPPRPG